MPQDNPRALLLGADTGAFDAQRSLEELADLARSAGAQPQAQLLQKRPAPDPATALGEGALAEAARQVEAQQLSLVIYDGELTGTQLRNMEKLCGCRVIDRTMLILDIFAQRAQSGAGRLQVELAQQKYLLPRLAGLGQQLSRLGGGIGTRGPGETQLETDRRHIRRRIAALEKELQRLARHRQLLRDRRRKEGRQAVALVGYTNAGKSTLLNALTRAGVLAEDRLFATLDPTARALCLPNGRTVLLVDTVGFISRLPHHLVEAFHSTLEEAACADLIVQVCDASHPDLAAQRQVTQETLCQLGAGAIPVVTALNKCDLLPCVPTLPVGDTVAVSARTGAGLPQLLAAIARALPGPQQEMQLLIPFAQGALLDAIRREGRVLSQQFTEQGVLLRALVSPRLAPQLSPFRHPAP